MIGKYHMKVITNLAALDQISGGWLSSLNYVQPEDGGADFGGGSGGGGGLSSSDAAALYSNSGYGSTGSPNTVTISGSIGPISASITVNPGALTGCVIASQAIGATAGVLTENPIVYRVTSMGVSSLCNSGAGSIKTSFKYNSLP